MLKTDIMFVKKNNKRLIRDTMSQCREATKPELAEKTGLSVVTVNSLVTEMVEVGELLEGGTVPSGGGRPSMQYLYNPNYRHVAILYGHQKENQNHFHGVIINLNGEKLWEEEFVLEDVQVISFDDFFDRAFQKFPDISRIVFGLPGEKEGEVITINDYPGIVGGEFLPHYRERYQVPVLFENDINAMTYGYYHMQNHKRKNAVVGMYFPRLYYPGVGIILYGEIYYGVNNFAGEINEEICETKWDCLDYTDRRIVIECIGKMLLTYSCILAPECFILYGDFFEKEDTTRLKNFVEEKLNYKYTINIEFSNSLEKDYEQGLTFLALDELREKEEI